jgi:hypothetical protein
MLLENSFEMAKRFASVSQQQERQVAEALVKVWTVGECESVRVGEALVDREVD